MEKSFGIVVQWEWSFCERRWGVDVRDIKCGQCVFIIVVIDRCTLCTTHCQCPLQTYPSKEHSTESLHAHSSHTAPYTAGRREWEMFSGFLCVTTDCRHCRTCITCVVRAQTQTLAVVLCSPDWSLWITTIHQGLGCWDGPVSDPECLTRLNNEIR